MAICIYPKWPAKYLCASEFVIFPCLTNSCNFFTFFFNFLFPLSLIFSLYSFILYPKKFTPCLLLNICVFLFNSKFSLSFRNFLISFKASIASFSYSSLYRSATACIYICHFSYTFLLCFYISNNLFFLLLLYLCFFLEIV